MPSRVTIVVLLSVGHIYSPTCRCASCGFLLRNDGEVAFRLFFLKDRERCGAPLRRESNKLQKDGMRMADMRKCTPLSIIMAFAFIVALCGHVFSYTAGPEGIEWQLVEVAGTPILPLASGKQPYFRLDPAQKRAIGFSGCNNFFSGYELRGSTLKFGLIGSTRMACPEPESRVETGFFKALEKTREWKINDNMLLLTSDGDIVARFEMKRVEPAPDPGSTTFLSTRFPSGK
jgi:heat shock protein HslJ